MKQIKLLIAVLAVVFSSASAFTPHTKFTTTAFSFISGQNPAHATAWTYTTTPNSCNQPSGTPCVIFANLDGSTTHPLQSDVDALKNASNTFTQPYFNSSTQLRVRVKP